MGTPVVNENSAAESTCPGMSENGTCFSLVVYTSPTWWRSMMRVATPAASETRYSASGLGSTRSGSHRCRIGAISGFVPKGNLHHNTAEIQKFARLFVATRRS